MTYWQKRVAAAFACLVVLTTLFPPFIIEARNVNINMGYAFILAPPGRSDVTASVDTSTLMTQWLGLGLVTVILLVLLGKGDAPPRNARYSQRAQDALYDCDSQTKVTHRAINSDSSSETPNTSERAAREARCEGSHADTPQKRGLWQEIREDEPSRLRHQAARKRLPTFAPVKLDKIQVEAIAEATPSNNSAQAAAVQAREDHADSAPLQRASTGTAPTAKPGADAAARRSAPDAQPRPTPRPTAPIAAPTGGTKVAPAPTASAEAAQAQGGAMTPAPTVSNHASTKKTQHDKGLYDDESPLPFIAIVLATVFLGPLLVLITQFLLYGIPPKASVYGASLVYAGYVGAAIAFVVWGSLPLLVYRLYRVIFRRPCSRQTEYEWLFVGAVLSGIGSLYTFVDNPLPQDDLSQKAELSTAQQFVSESASGPYTGEPISEVESKGQLGTVGDIIPLDQIDLSRFERVEPGTTANDDFIPLDQIDWSQIELIEPAAPQRENQVKPKEQQKREQ